MKKLFLAMAAAAFAALAATAGEGDSAKVVDCALRLLNDPGDIRAHYEMVACAYRQRNYYAAYTLALELLRRERDVAAVMGLEAYMNLEDNILRFSEEEYLRSVYGIPGFGEREDELSQHLCDSASFILARPEDGLADADKIARRDLAARLYATAYARNFNPLNNEARCRHAELIREADPSGAFDAYAEAIRRGCREYAALRAAVGLAAELGRADEAHALMESVFEVDPGDFVVLDLCIDTARLAGDAALAEAYLNYRAALFDCDEDAASPIRTPLLCRMLNARNAWEDARWDMSRTNSMEAAVKSRMASRVCMRYCDDGLSEEARRQAWPFDVAAFERELAGKIARTDCGLYCVKGECNDYGEGTMDDGNVAINPSIRWMNRKMEAWATNALDGAYGRLSRGEMERMLGTASVNDGTFCWKVGANEYFIIQRVEEDSAFASRDYIYMRWDGAGEPVIAATFNSLPDAKIMSAVRSCIAGSPAGRNNLAALMWNEVVDRNEADTTVIRRFLKAAKEAGNEVAAGNLVMMGEVASPYSRTGTAESAAGQKDSSNCFARVSIPWGCVKFDYPDIDACDQQQADEEFMESLLTACGFEYKPSYEMSECRCYIVEGFESWFLLQKGVVWCKGYPDGEIREDRLQLAKETVERLNARAPSTIRFCMDTCCSFWCESALPVEVLRRMASLDEQREALRLLSKTPNDAIKSYAPEFESFLSSAEAKGPADELDAGTEE